MTTNLKGRDRDVPGPARVQTTRKGFLMFVILLPSYLFCHSNEKKIGSQGLSTVIILYFETCYVASMVSPGGVVVITAD